MTVDRNNCFPSLEEPRFLRDKVVPLSYNQQCTFDNYGHLIDTPLYYLSTTRRLTRDADISVIRKCVNALVRRHEILRTSFPYQGSLRVQRVARELDIELPVIDLRTYAESERGKEVSRLARAEAKMPFDLANGPLLRSVLYLLGENNSILQIVFHEINLDRTSVDIIWSDFTDVYEGTISGSPIQLSAPDLQYGDYATWERQQWSDPDVVSAKSEFWREHLGGGPYTLTWPADVPRRRKRNLRGDVYQFSVPHGLCRTIMSLARRERVGLFSVFVSAFEILLFLQTGQETFLVGTNLGKRDRPEFRRVVGPVASPLILRADVDDQLPIREFMRGVRQRSAQEHIHGALPDYLVTGALDWHPRGDPPFQVMLDLFHARASSSEVRTSVEAWEPPCRSHTARFDITLYITVTAGRLHGLVRYKCDLLNHSSIEELTTQFQLVLSRIAENPSLQISELARN